MHIYKKSFFTFLLSLFAIGCFAFPSQGDVLYSYGFSPKGIALGGAYSALVDDYSAAYYNPAASVWQKRPSVGLGYAITGSDLFVEGAKTPDLESTQGLIFGTVLPLPLGRFMKDRLAFGFSCFFPDGVVLAIKVPHPSYPQWVNLQNSGRSITLIPTLAVRIIDGLAIAGGAQLFDNTSGQLSAMVDPNGRIEATVGQELTTFGAPVAGIHFAPGMIWPKAHGWKFGFVYREKFYTKYEIPVNTYVGPVPLEVTFDAVSLFIPRQLLLGIGWESQHFSAEFDGSYNFWSEMPDPNLSIDVNFTIPLLPIDFSSSEDYEPNLHNTITSRAGFEYRPIANEDHVLALRMGYYFDPSPLPIQDGVTNYLDPDRHVASMGLGYALKGINGKPLPGTFETDLAFQYQHLQPTEYFKNNNVDISNPGYPSIKYGGSLWAVAITFSTRFDID